MGVYIAPIHNLRVNSINDFVDNSSKHEPYKWFDYFLKKAIEKGSKYILFQQEEEREFDAMARSYDFLDNFHDKLVKNDIELIICFSGDPSYHLYSCFDRYNNIKIYNTPLYFFYFLYYLDKDIILKFSKKINNIQTNKNFHKLFITLNNKPSPERCELLENLAKNNLLDCGVYSWLKDGHPNFNFKYFNNNLKKLTTTPSNGRSFYWNDLLYNNPLINVVTENTVPGGFVLTEKTCKSILIGQPFISLANQFFHKRLSKYGFELYDEIFDYSFDSEHLLENRVNGIVKNLINLKDKNLSELYKLISHKLEKNKQIALDIIKERKFINKEYLKLLIDNKEQFKGQISTFNFFNLDN